MQRYFSPSTGGFYSESINGARQIAGELTAAERKAGKRAPLVDNPNCTIPADAAPISEERYAELIKAQAEGKFIMTAGIKPVAVEPSADAAELEAGRRRERDRRVAASDWTQLADSPLHALTKKAWADYRQTLRDLDMSGTGWPDAPSA